MENSPIETGEMNPKTINETDRDLISKLPDELLFNILSRLSTEEALRTGVLSTRWVDVWKNRPSLGLDPRRITSLQVDFLQRANQIFWRMITQVMRRHWRQLGAGRVNHLSEQFIDGKVDVWNQQEERNIKELVFLIEMSPRELPNCKLYFCHRVQPDFAPGRVSSPSLVSLELTRYKIEAELGIPSCRNLKTLKLVWVFVESQIVNRIVASSLCLEELVIQFCYNLRAGLKIDNNRLKFLELSGFGANEIEVSGADLDVLVLDNLRCPSDCFAVHAPKIKFNRDYWSGPHVYIACNLSTEGGERALNVAGSVLNESMGYEIVMKNPRVLRNVGNLAINVDLKNQRETEILSNFLRECVRLRFLELRIKKQTLVEDADYEDGSSLIQGSKFWENLEPVACIEDQLESILINNFSGTAEEIAFAAYLVTKATSVRNITICLEASAAERVTMTTTELLALPKASETLAISLKPEARE